MSLLHLQEVIIKFLGGSFEIALEIEISQIMFTVPLS